MKKLISIALLTISFYSPLSYAFLESLGLSIVSDIAVRAFRDSPDNYRSSDYVSPIEEFDVEDKHATHCDPYGGCTDYISTTTVRKVREYRYDYKPIWDEWAYGDYQ